ncbi:MAG: ATP-dependent DNA helicase, partial [Anaerolineae bacterium]
GLLYDRVARDLVGEVDAVARRARAPALASFDIEEQKALFLPGGLLERQFPGYEFRPQQVAMLEAVVETLRDGGVLMIEAGTGTGKTLAYLVPAAYYAVSQGKRVVISTNTINLQDQIYQKDIPDLQRILPFPFRASVLKGRSNYLCLRKLQTMKQSRQLSAEEVHALVRILIWAQSTATGDQAELMLPTDTDRAVWAYLSAESETCLNEQCRYFQRGSCFLQRARQRAAGSHLVIVNHSLLLADAAVENAVLPDYDCLIVDEAHHLEDATTKQLSFHISQPAIEQEIGWLIGSSHGRGFQGLVQEAVFLLSPHLAPDSRAELTRLSQEIAGLAQQVREAVQSLFSSLAVFAEYQNDATGDYSLRLRITDGLRVQPRWSQIEIMWDNAAMLISGLRERLRRLEQMAPEVSSPDDVEGIPELIRDLAGRTQFWSLIQSEITAILTSSRANRVDWLEILPEAGTTSLHSAPLHVGDMISEYLLNRRHAVVFTSATLRAGEDFSFLRERLGIAEAREVALDSPFDYRASTLIYCPTDMPEPSQPFYLASVAKAIEQVALALRGRTLVLFTSYYQLRKAVELVGPALHEAGITILAQGNGSSRTQLLQQFKEGTDMVLFGTRSFWEGIDVVGPALSCVIITRLPFAVPTEPIFEARSEAFEDPFQQYSVPDAILRFRQGFGRLIRSHSDCGVVVILDRRVLSKRYGQMFLKALPSCTVEHGPLDFVGHRAAQWLRARS